MKPVNAMQPDLFAPKAPNLPTEQPKPASQPRPVSQAKKTKEHRTEAGDRCEGSIRIPGLSHSLCDRCGEWIATGRFEQ